ncbi:hypothetical protein AB0F93_00255 [Micromonospora tulbaghiae]|uniref:hypothetical protein n=1 Tax=Micromonospora tulbaghiae TaxID=479978 RepID=UPI00331F5D2E
MSAEAGQMAREMEDVIHALRLAGAHLASLDRAAAVRELNEREPYSPLRTKVEQAEISAAAVKNFLRETART